MEKDKQIGKSDILKNALYIIIFFVGIYFIFWQFQPLEEEKSEYELCAEAIDEAKYFLSVSNHDLINWMTYKYKLIDEHPTSIKITDTYCDVLERDEIEVTLNLDVKTSKNRLAHIEAVVYVTDGYADYIEFYQDF
ncbi:MAG: hypothetical protein A3F40_04090 [Chlamydiae bacterium RIFCSPHIGHO2_12_FULL_27_8]|nr:MAG: hypothetical protein A3F40_04090 [Chlamydiae bacterium RIFCSPHIGHO2_12_FULL_27_8]